MITKKSNYQHLRDELLRQIQERQLLPGMALPSENTLAADYGISRPTVRKALDLLERDLFIIRRPGIGSFVNTPNEPGIIREQRRLVIGTDCYGPGSEFYYGHIASGIKDSCSRHNCNLMIVNKQDLDTNPQFDGLVLAVTSPDDFEYFADIAANGTPVVLINRFPSQAELAYVSVDYVAESTRAVEYLLMLGHRNIAIIGSGSDIYSIGPRTRGWAQAFRNRNLIPPEHLIISADELNGNTDKLACFLQNNDISALFITRGALLPVVTHAAIMSGINISSDMSIICFDDVENLSESIGVPSSYIRMPLVSMGKRAVEYLVKRHAAPTTPVLRLCLEAGLVINSACKPPQ